MDLTIRMEGIHLSVDGLCVQAMEGGEMGEENIGKGFGEKRNEIG